MNQPLAYHVAFRLLDSRVIAPAPEQRRLAARIILSHFREAQLLCFNVSDTHIHLLHAELEPFGAERVRRIKIALSRQLRLAVGFAGPDSSREVLSQAHLQQAFSYILRQQPRHGLVWDPFHEASNLSDLLGLRTIGVKTAQTVRQLLPRIQRNDLLSLLGVTELIEASGPAHLLLEAARAASGLTDLERRDPSVRCVWRAVLEVTDGELSQRQAAELFGVRRETLSRLKQVSAAQPQLVRAIRLQLGLRRSLAGVSRGEGDQTAGPRAGQG